MMILCEVYNNQIKGRGGILVEKWKMIKDSKDFQVSDEGNIRSLDRIMIRKDGKKYTVKGKVLKSYVMKYGYCMIALKGDIKSSKTVHRMVMKAFLPIENMDEWDVNHEDGNKKNNRLDNLKWCTKKENMKHAKDTGLWHPEKRCGGEHPMSILTEQDVIEIRRLLKTKELKQTDIAKKYKVSDCTISEIKTRRKWKHI